MNFAPDKMLRSALLASAAAVSVIALPTFAFAQPAAAAAAEEEEVEEVVVTGSRIRRSELTSVQPIQVITTENMEKRGFTNVADALNELPSAGVPVNPIGDQGSFGVGRNFVNIFNLGTNRTLTLVNGRRFVGGNPASIFTGAGAGGQVDLNVIPTGLIDRIETIQAGGSATYGSDAISGVVNIITKTEYDGVELDGLYGVSDEGDAETYRARIIAGKRLLDDRLSVFGSYEYNETTALAFTDRDVTARQLAFASNPLNRTLTDNIPGSIIILNRRVPEVTTGGLLTRTGGFALSGLFVSNPTATTGRQALQLGPDGTFQPYDTGVLFQPSIASGGQGLNLAELSSLVSPVKRHVANAFVKYDITDNIRFTTELLYAEFKATEPFNQPIYNSALFGGNSGALRFSTANPFLPAATRAAILSQAGPQVVASPPGQNPLAAPPTTVTLPALAADPASPGDVLFFLHRASVDLGPNRTRAEGETMRGVFAVEGDFEFLGRGFNWDVAANFGESSGTFESPNIDQNRFLAAIDVTRNAAGQIVCRNPANGCVPLNLFGANGPSQAARDWISVQFVSEFRLIQTNYVANFGGDLFSLPAGDVSFNVGYEYRLEKSDFNPNDPQEAGVGRSAAITALQGKFDTNEFYGEVSVPIFGEGFNFPLMHRLEVEGQFRRVDHSRAGEDDAWQYGGRYYPIPDLLLRAHKSRSFRAPAITELFLPQATSFTFATDPCDARNLNSGPNPAARQANCQAAFSALGLPANFNLTSQVQAATVQGSTSGNPNLQNELADQWSIGFVYQPSWFPGLSVAFDWVDIELTAAIANFNLTSILQVCYDSPSGDPAACSRFQRGTATSARPGQILGFGEAVGNGMTATGPQSGFINAGYLNFDGFTAQVNYTANLDEVFNGVFADWLGGNPGRLSFDYDLFHIDTLETSVTGLGFDLNRNESEIGDNTWQWRLQTTYSRDPLEVTWTVNYKGKAVFNNDFNNETRAPLGVDDYFVHDLAVTYDLDDWVNQFGMGLDGVRARFIVRNVFDEEAPFGTTGLGVYDPIGRYYQFGLTARF